MDQATRKIAESAFRAGWYAACFKLAEAARKGGQPETARVLMEFASDPDPIVVEEGKGTPPGHTALWMERQSLKKGGG